MVTIDMNPGHSFTDGPILDELAAGRLSAAEAAEQLRARGARDD